MIQQQAASPHRLVFIGLGLDHNPAARAQLQQMATASGGKLVLAGDPTMLPKVIVDVVTGPPPVVPPPPPVAVHAGTLLTPMVHTSSPLLLGGLLLLNVALVAALVLLRLRR